MKDFILASWGVDGDKFPAPQPISIERRHIPELFNNEYVVAEKSDGVRQLLVCTPDGKCKFVNRMFNNIDCDFKMPKLARYGTILDGELMDDGTFIVYDSVMICGQSILSYKLIIRLKFITQFIRRSSEPRLRLKRFFLMKEFDEFEKSLSSIDYKMDGLVFVPVNEAVGFGTQKTLFKWKPRDLNTIDFMFVKRQDHKIGMYIQEFGKLVFEQFMEDENHPIIADIKFPAIIECKRIDGKWTPIIVRTDKNHPNSRFTFYKTLKNIREDIQLTEFNRKG